MAAKANRPALGGRVRAGIWDSAVLLRPAPTSGRGAAMMASSCLQSEFDTAVSRFHGAGCLLPGDLSLYVPALGLQAIEAGDDFYQPTERGHLALVVPVYAGPMPSFMNPVDEIPELMDLVAFRLSDPGRWWRRTGLALYLGEHLIMSSNTWGASVKVVDTPLAWLNARGQAICPLTEDVWHLRNAAKLLVDSPELGIQIERNLSRPFPIPPILVKAPT